MYSVFLTGDHGGDSEDELNALLFAYSKKQKFFVDPEFSTGMMRQVALLALLFCKSPFLPKISVTLRERQVT